MWVWCLHGSRLVRPIRNGIAFMPQISISSIWYWLRNTAKVKVNSRSSSLGLLTKNWSRHARKCGIDAFPFFCPFFFFFYQVTLIDSCLVTTTIPKFKTSYIRVHIKFFLVYYHLPTNMDECTLKDLNNMLKPFLLYGFVNNLYNEARHNSIAVRQSSNRRRQSRWRRRRRRLKCHCF